MHTRTLKPGRPPTTLPPLVTATRNIAPKLLKYAFVFYLVKGIIWLGVFGAAAAGLTGAL